MIHVLALIELHPGTREKFLHEFHALIPLVHAEHGCIEYGSAIDCPTAIPVQSLLGNDSVMVVEKWSDTAALEAHLTAPHMTDYRTKVRDFVKNVSLRILRPSTDAA